MVQIHAKPVYRYYSKLRTDSGSQFVNISAVLLTEDGQ